MRSLATPPASCRLPSSGTRGELPKTKWVSPTVPMPPPSGGGQGGAYRLTGDPPRFWLDNQLVPVRGRLVPVSTRVRYGVSEIYSKVSEICSKISVGLPPTRPPCRRLPVTGTAPPFRGVTHAVSKHCHRHPFWFRVPHENVSHETLTPVKIKFSLWHSGAAKKGFPCNSD